MRRRPPHIYWLCLAAAACLAAAWVDGYHEARMDMVTAQLIGRDIRDPRVIEAMRTVPRHEFVPEELRPRAYGDHPLPIGYRQTISQPYIVAKMTELARLTPDSKVLEIGTGSGYQAAVLAELAKEVFTIEIVTPLAAQAKERLARYPNVTVREGDGYRGWPEQAPFDAIVVTAAPERVPPALLEQLAPGGRLVIPVGSWWQELQVHTRGPDGVTVERIFPVRFVPMTGGPEASGEPEQDGSSD